MYRIGRDPLSEILLTAPVWVRSGLGARGEQVRERAADALAATIINKLTPTPEIDVNQLALPL